MATGLSVAAEPLSKSPAVDGSESQKPRYRLADLCWIACGRGERFHYIARDDAADRYVRLGPDEYQLACCFAGGQDVVAAMKQWLRQRTSDLSSIAKGQKVLQFLITRQILLPMHEESDAVSPAATDAAATVPPAAPPAASQLANASRSVLQLDPLSFRLPIISGPLLQRAVEPLLRRTMINRAIGPISVAAIGFVAYLLASTAILEQSRQLLISHSKLYWLWAWLLLKIVHEIGHAAVAIASGSTVGGAGITFFCFAPIPYVDVSDIWRSGRRRVRLACSAAGVMAEAIVAASAGLLWLFCEQPTVSYLCCATVALGTVTTLTFNANPLMRYDGYYFFSDLIDQPDLWQRSAQALRTRLTYLLGCDTTIAGNLLHAAYGFAALVYRFLLLGSLAIGAVTVWQGIGLVLTLLGGYRWLILPAVMAVRRQRAERRLAPRTLIAWPKVAMRSVGWGVLLAILLFAPLPIFRRVPGVAEYEKIQALHSQRPGFLSQIHFVSGSDVSRGETLIELQEPSVDLELVTRELEHDIVASQIESASGGQTYSDARILIDRLSATQARVESAQSDQRHLKIAASLPGVFFRPADSPPLGSYVRPEDSLGAIYRRDSLQVKLSLPQSLVEDYRDALQSADARRRAVVVSDEDGRRWLGRLKRIAVRGSDEMETPQLSGTYGGPLAVVSDPNTAEPAKLAGGQTRFEAWVEIPGDDQPYAGQIVQARLLTGSGHLADEIRRIVADWISSLTMQP